MPTVLMMYQPLIQTKISYLLLSFGINDRQRLFVYFLRSFKDTVAISPVLPQKLQTIGASSATNFCGIGSYSRELKKKSPKYFTYAGGTN